MEEQNEKGHYWTEFMIGFEAKWAIAPGCPFCGANFKKLESYWVRRAGRPLQIHRIACNQCGAQGAVGETPEEAVDEWSRRPTSEWTPLGPHSYVLPPQALGSLLVYDNPRKVAFIDWENEEVHRLVEIDMGDFRICHRHKGENDAGQR